MFDHVSFKVGDLAATRAFYAAALAPLGIAVAAAFDGVVGMGRNGRAQLWLIGSDAGGGPFHLAIDATSRAQVRAFYAAALAAGATDNGAPGLRPHYHADYYGAFVIAPGGHNLEAVCRAPADIAGA